MSTNEQDHNDPTEGNDSSTIPHPAPANVINTKVPVALRASTLRFDGGMEVPCFVLADGTPLLTTRGILGVFAGSKTGNIERYTAAIAGNSSGFSLGPEMQFRLPENNAIATGYKAETLVDICNLYVRALSAGTLHPKQVPLAMRALVIVSACAKMGITALVWEATGYDKIKAENALETRLQAALREEAVAWEQLFTEEFFNELARMLRVKVIGSKRPHVFAAFIAEYFYEFFDHDVYDALKVRNPRDEATGERNFKHHQFLQPAVRRAFVRHQVQVITLMKSSASLKHFRMNFDATFRNAGIQLSFGGVA